MKAKGFTLEESLPPEARAGAQSDAEPRPSTPLAELLRIGPLRVILAVGFFASLAFAALPATFALYANRVLFPDLADASRTQMYIGLMLTFNGLMQVVTQLALLKPLVSRLGERKLLVLGMGTLLVASVLFALGHLLVDFNGLRLAVFFPALVFGWMRQYSGSILASVLFHASSNLVSELLHDSFF